MIGQDFITYFKMAREAQITKQKATTRQADTQSIDAIVPDDRYLSTGY